MGANVKRAHGLKVREKHQKDRKNDQKPVGCTMYGVSSYIQHRVNGMVACGADVSAGQVRQHVRDIVQLAGHLEEMYEILARTGLLEAGKRQEVQKEAGALVERMKEVVLPILPTLNDNV